MSKTMAYLRVSTTDQDLEKNKNDILRLANDKDLGKVHFVEEKASGTITLKKRKIANIIEVADDCYIVEFTLKSLLMLIINLSAWMIFYVCFY